jgi:tetratricopeptide (TPR) repeat protein
LPAPRLILAFGMLPCYLGIGCVTDSNAKASAQSVTPDNRSEHHQDEPPVRDPARAMEWVHEGRELRRRGEIEDAVMAYEKALMADSKSGYAHLEWAVSAQDLGMDEALIREHLMEALTLLPQNPRAQYISGFFFESSDENQRAVSHYEKAIELRPEYQEARLRLGGILHSQNKPADAKPHYQTVVEQDPTNLVAHIALATIAEQGKNLEEAELHLREIVRYHGQHPGHHLRLIRFLVRIGAHQKAEAAKRQLKIIAPLPTRKLRNLKQSS